MHHNEIGRKIAIATTTTKGFFENRPAFHAVRILYVQCTRAYRIFSLNSENLQWKFHAAGLMTNGSAQFMNAFIQQQREKSSVKGGYTDTPNHVENNQNDPKPV